MSLNLLDSMAPERIAGRIVLMIAYGQSNSEAGGLRRLRKRERVVTPGVIDPWRALMLDTGLFGTQKGLFQPDSIAAFVPAIENVRWGESGGSSFMRYSLACDAALNRLDTVYLYRTSGQSGQPISVLADGTAPPFRNFLETTRRAAEIARADGKHLSSPHYLWDQGEADRKTGTSFQNYLEKLLALHNRLNGLVRNRTGQSEPLWMLTSILAAPSMRARRGSPDVSLAQVAACNSGPTIAPVCSPYWFNGRYGYNPEQAAHWTPLGKALLRKFGARAARIAREAMCQDMGARLGDTIRRYVCEATAGGYRRWVLKEVPFETAPRTDIASVRRVGTTITGEVHYAEGGLSIYSEYRGPAANSGFEWSGSGSIAGVGVDNSGPRSKWIVTLDAAAPGVLSYGITRQDTIDSSGPHSWGDLFDSCAEPSLAVPGLTLRQGLLPFRIALD